MSWISTKDRLPNESGLFLVVVSPKTKADKWPPIRFAHYVEYKNFKDGEYFPSSWRWEPTHNIQGYEVINKWSTRVKYWMPIPESPDEVD